MSWPSKDVFSRKLKGNSGENLGVDFSLRVKMDLDQSSLELDVVWTGHDQQLCFFFFVCTLFWAVFSKPHSVWLIRGWPLAQRSLLLEGTLVWRNVAHVGKKSWMLNFSPTFVFLKLSLPSKWSAFPLMITAVNRTKRVFSKIQISKDFQLSSQ